MRRTLPRLTLALAASAALGLSACGGSADTGTDAAAPATTSSEEEAPAADPSSGAPPPASSDGGGEVPEALAFTATTVGGESFDGASLAGRDVAIWFWAPW